MAEVIFQPKLDYARGETSLETSKYAIMANNGKEMVTLSSKNGFEIHGDRAISNFTIEQGQKVELVLRYGAGKPLSSAVYNSAGRLDKARTLFEGLLGYRNRLELFTEMIAPSTGEALGNLPQALSHLTVIITGLELTQALQGKCDIEK